MASCQYCGTLGDQPGRAGGGVANSTPLRLATLLSWLLAYTIGAALSHPNVVRYRV
jgi:hypothetical protein